MGNSDKQHIETELSRDLGLVSALAIGVGTMIAAGIFTLSGLAIRNVGSSAIISFLLAAIVALFTALTYCEFVSIYPRSGEGYLYARKTYPAPLAYFVGWALFLGYTASCGFYISSLSSYFIEFIWHSPLENLSGVLALIGLTLLNIKGTKESGGFQIVVTAAKVILLIWFIFGGLKFVQSEDMMAQFSTDILKITSTSALVFITFFGFSAIAASAGEVKNPVKTIPRAIFISMALVTILYTLVVLVTIAADLDEYTEASMGVAATRFLGPIGGMVIIGGALFSMISASNASIMAGSRVTLAMSQLGHLPREFGIINPKTKTPIISLFIVGGTILLFILLLPLEDLAHFADTVLLIALILVNAALIVHRRKYPDIERPFRVPLVPLLPLLGIVANLYLLIQILHHPIPFVLAIGALILGMVGFLVWKGSLSDAESLPGAPSRLALGRFATPDTERKYRILVPISNPATAKPLIDLAAAIAKQHDGEILALSVVQVPEQTPIAYVKPVFGSEQALLESCHAYADAQEIPLTSIVWVGHNTAKTILEAGAKHHANLILMGWKGHTSSRQKIMGEVTDAVVTHAKRDLMLVKFGQSMEVQNILLPTAGGEHARAAEVFAAELAKSREGKLTACRIHTDKETIRESEEKLNEVKARILKSNQFEADSLVVDGNEIEAGILEAAKNFDTIMLGATRDSIYQQISARCASLFTCSMKQPTASWLKTTSTHEARC